MVIRRSMNSYIRSPRSVTLAPIARPSRILKVAIAFLARVDDGLLAGDGGQIVERLLDLLGIRSRLARADVQHDLVDLRHLHDVGVAELLHQLGLDDVVVALLEARHIAGFGRARAHLHGGAGVHFAALGRLGRLGLGLGWLPADCWLVPASDIDDLTGLLREANLASVVQCFESDRAWRCPTWDRHAPDWTDGSADSLLTMPPCWVWVWR